MTIKTFNINTDKTAFVRHIFRTPSRGFRSAKSVLLS